MHGGVVHQESSVARQRARVGPASWAYGGTDNEADVAMELEAVARRLRAGGKWHDLAYMLNLPANRGIATVVSAVVDQLIAGRADVGPAVVQVARPGSREAKLRAIRVLDGIGEPRLAAELRSRLQDRLVTVAPVTQPWSQGPGLPPGYAGSSPPGYAGGFFSVRGARVDKEYTAPYAPHGYPARVAMPYPVGPVAGYPVYPQVQNPAACRGRAPVPARDP